LKLRLWNCLFRFSIRQVALRDLTSSPVGRFNNRAKVRFAITGSAALVALAATGCGDSRNANTGFRPPVTKIAGLLLDGKATHISPTEIGAGPITIKIANKTGAPVLKVSVRSVDGGCVADQADAGPIPAGGTGTISATLVQGTCEIVADSMKASRLLVGPERESAQNKLLLP